MGELNEAAVRGMMQKIVEVAEQDAAKLLRCQKNAEQNQAAAPQDVIRALTQELHYVEPWQPATPKQRCDNLSHFGSKLSRFVAKVNALALKVQNQKRDQADTLSR